MTRIETLTAYKCNFSYLRRNNPLIDKQREAIKKGDSPEYSFSDFMETYKSFIGGLVFGENTDRAISLSEEKINVKDRNNIKIWHLIPNAGKQGKPITVMKQTGKKYNFGSDAAALYDYHIFVYENSESIIAIFHRQNGSGCKSVFLETANKAIKHKGLKFEMELIAPITDKMENVVPTRVTLQYAKTNKSTDVADNMGRKRKKYIVRDLGLNLEENENKRIFDIIRDMQFGKINKVEAFAKIKAEIKDADEYNDAVVRLKIGKHSRGIRWNDFEHIMGARDITNDLYSAYKVSKDYVGELTKLANNYYKEIVESGEV